MAKKNSRANVTIDVRIRTRADMNTGTPRFGNWTYHHIQPVRIYYLAASTVLRFITDPDCYDETRALGVNALCQMVNNNPNAATIRSFVDANRGVLTEDGARHPIAKLCASPPFGGFAGVNPAQREDDPGEGMEMHRPLSAPLSWWESVGRLGTEVLAAFGLHQMPRPNTDLSATKMSFEWNETVLSLVQDISHASACGPANFVNRDWQLANGGASWTVLRHGVQSPWPPRVGGGDPCPKMSLRRRGNMYTYLDDRDVPLAAMVRRGVVPLRPRRGGDYLDFV